MKKTIIYFCLITFPTILRSQEIEPIQTDRPDQTETSHLVPINYIQAEIGLQLEANSNNFAQIDHPNILLKYGINNRFELRLLSRIYSEINKGENVTYLNEFGLGFKTNITNEFRVIPKISFISHMQIIFNNDSKKVDLAPDFRFTFLHTLNEKFTLSYNLGMEWDLSAQSPIYLYTLSLSYAISNYVGMYIESYAFFEQQQNPTHLMDGGFTFLMNKNIQFDLSAGTTINQKKTTYFISTGISFRKKLCRTYKNILSY